VRFRLQTRLFLWLIAAVVGGVLASWATVLVLRSDPEAAPMHTMARTFESRLVPMWEDPVQTDAELARMRTETGIDLHLVRDPDSLPAVVRAHRSSLVFEPAGVAYVPVARNGHVVGALRFTADIPRERSLRQTLFLVVALLVLVIAVRSVSARVVGPLEQVAGAANRFGEGDLTVRTHVDRRASPEVRDVASAFDTMASRVERMVRDQRELLAAVSHELRSPLGRARVALELARDQGAQAPALERTEKSLDELDAVLGDLLAVTRAGLSDVKREPTKLVAFLRARFPEIEGAPVMVTGDAGISAPIDPALFARAVGNALENARHHAGPGPIDVSVSSSDGRAVVLVRDHGPGLPAELVEKAFDPFVRGDAARSRASSAHSSTGLGLAIVRRVLEAHGGTASIRNLEEAGKIAGAELRMEVPTRS